MLLTFLRYIKGYLRIRITGRSAERFINACRYKGICLWGLKSDFGNYEMNITIHGFRQLKPVLKKTGTKVVVVKRIGLPFFLQKYRGRRFFFCGGVFCVVLIVVLSRFIWNIDISGNSMYTDEALLKFLASTDVKTGIRKSEVDCGRIVKDVRKAYDDIVWVSASVKGTVLYVKIKENEDSMDTAGQMAHRDKPTDIVADRNCIIRDIVVRKGVVKVKPGERVKKGTVLVSGQVPVVNDAKEVTGYRYQEADADIVGETTIAYQDTNPHTYEVKKRRKGPKGEEQGHTAVSLTMGNYRFSFGDVKDRYPHREVYTRQKQLKIFENFYLPVTVAVKKITPYESVKKTYTPAQEQKLLSGRFYRSMGDLEKKGVEILENNVKIYTGRDFSRAEGTITVRMPVGEKQPSKRPEAPENHKEEQQGETVHGNDGSGN